MVTIPTQSTVKLLGQTYLTSNDMRDLHQMIINNVGKVVGRETIILDDNLVIHNLIFKLHFPVHQIFELSLSFRHAHSDHKWLTVGLLLLDLLCAEVLQAKSIIHSFGVFLATDLHSHLCKALRSTKTWVGIAILYLHNKKCEMDPRVTYLHQLLSELCIDFESLRLIVWAVGTLWVTLITEWARTLCPFETCPLHHLDDVFNGAVHLTITISVLDS